MQVRMTGAMNKPKHSRWAMFEYLYRMVIDILAQVTICFMIVTTPKDSDESVVDQTMNFTALVILLQIDNILGGIFQKKIDNFKYSFDYDKDTAEQQFNRAADFLQERAKLFWIQGFFENLINFLSFFVLAVIFLFIPAIYLLCYFIIPVTTAAAEGS